MGESYLRHPNYEIDADFVDDDFVPAEEAERLIDIIRAECPECRTPEQNGLRDGYTCPRHYEAIYRQPMPTLGEA